MAPHSWGGAKLGSCQEGLIWPVKFPGTRQRVWWGGCTWLGAALELTMGRLRLGLWGCWKLRTCFLGLCPGRVAALFEELIQPSKWERASSWGGCRGPPVAQGRPALGARRQPLGTRQPRAICEAGMSSFPQFLPPKPPPMLLLRPLPSPRFRVSGLIPAQECNYLSSCPRPGEYKEQTWHFRFSLLAVLLGEVRQDGVPSTGTGAWLLASPRFRFLSQTQKSEGGRVVGWCGQTASRTQHTTTEGRRRVAGREMQTR